jgi:hypothetical protein
MPFRRLRWRMRGAWLWPTFVLLVLAEGVLLNELPFYGEGPHGFIPGALIAGFANLAVVAIVAPLAAGRLRRRRPDLPKLIATDYAGTALVWVLALGFLAGGLAHRPAMRAEKEEQVMLAAAVRRYVAAQAPEYEPYLGLADSLELSEDFHRACVPGPAHWPLCLFVETDQSPAGVRLDTERIPNGRYRLP